MHRLAQSTLSPHGNGPRAVRPHSAAIALLALVVSGCVFSSAPTHFYSLASVAPTGSTRPSLKAPVQVVVVHIPSFLDRAEIVRTGANMSLELAGDSRWGAPFGEMVQRVLTQDLLERLAAGDVVLPEQPAPSSTEALVLTILEFQSDLAGNVVFSGSWSLLPPGANHPRSSEYVKLTASANPSDYGDQAKVMSELLGEVADRIVHALPAVY
ncbi:MAG TPA: PqiC family protein [Steroidobacteraceae bacterium]|nr:PqiC family protein [Steroidobacteraceae bacterium]